MKFYYLRVPEVQGYDIVVTGRTPNECMKKAWDYYKKNFEQDFDKRSEWLEYHGATGMEISVGDVWTE